MLAATLDVDRAEVDHALEALRRVDRSMQPGLPGTGTWNSTLRSWLSIISSFLYCASPPSLEHRADPELPEQVRVEEGHVQRDGDLDLVAVDLDLDALRLERVQLRLGVVAGLGVRLDLAVDLAVRPVADGGELVAEARFTSSLYPEYAGRLTPIAGRNSL